MMFYISFEGVLIPIFIMVFFWGSTPENIQAGIYIMIYTILGSLPFLVTLIFFGMKNRLFFIILGWNNCYLSFFMGLTFILAFLVKLPIFIFHVWLPKAHVEAPVGGSMILAGILLKLGGYGIYRFSCLIKI